MNTLGLNLDLKVGDRVKTPCGHWGAISEVRVDDLSYTYAVEFDYDTPRSIENGNCFYYDGRQAFPAEGKATRIDPIRVAPSVGDKLRLSSDAFADTQFTVITRANAGAGDLIVERSSGGGVLYRINPTTLKDTDGDQWEIVKPAPTVTTFRNVYADGSLGVTGNERTFEETRTISKFDKVRIAILRQDTQDGAIVYAEMIPTDPQLRTRSNPDGINPFAETTNV